MKFSLRIFNNMLLGVFWVSYSAEAFLSAKPWNRPNSCYAFVADTQVEATPSRDDRPSIKEAVLEHIASTKKESNQYAEMFGLGQAEAAAYGLFSAIRQVPVPLGFQGQPFVIRHSEFNKVQETSWSGFFTLKDLEKAVQDDFLDASRGATESRQKGWQITDVSTPRGDSFEEARMTFEDVQLALEKGTVIMNAAGAHIPKLAGLSLACTEATFLPCALNLYVTAAGKRTSAPPHTDKQDVMVIQTSGNKHWKIFSPPNPALKPSADVFARGKNDDHMPLHKVENDCELLLETTLNPGDVLFCPAGFPHTTSTVTQDENLHSSDTSVHLTLGIDHHIWELDFLNTRRLALRRARVYDTALGQTGDDDYPFVGKVNELPGTLRNYLLAEMPLGLLDEDEKVVDMLHAVTRQLEQLSSAVDEVTASKVPQHVWGETVDRVRQQGRELLDIHREMYLAAIDEGCTRKTEEAMTAHMGQRTTMSPDRIQRLSLFRVKRFYDMINKSKESLKAWSHADVNLQILNSNNSGGLEDISDWAFTLPVSVGDEVEAELGGAFFPAKVVRAVGDSFDVNFFDGDRETGLHRRQIKLLKPPVFEPVTTNSELPSQMTGKQLKRLRKQQKKKSKA